MKRIIILSYNRLVTNGSGGTTVMCGLVQAALDQNFQVTHVGLTPESYNCQHEDLMYKPIRNSGQLRVVECIYKDKQFHSPTNIFRYLVDRSCFQSIEDIPDCLNETYDALVAFEFLPIRLSRNITAKSKFLILGDPPGERMIWSGLHLKGNIHFLAMGCIVRLCERRYWKKTINRDSIIGMFGTKHATDWSKSLKREIVDLRPLMPKIQASMEERRKANKVVLSFGGTLASTASKHGNSFLSKTLIPFLKADKGRNFTLLIAGNCPDSFRKLFDNVAGVKILGRVSCFEETLAKAHIFLLPMHYPIGARTRVCSALQAGCFCICNRSVLVNLPELAYCESVAFAEKDGDYIKLIQDYALNINKQEYFSKKAIDFFEEHYSYSVSAKKILNNLVLM